MTTLGAKSKQLFQHCLTMQRALRWNKLFSSELEWESIDSPYKTRSRLSVSVETLNGALWVLCQHSHTKHPHKLLTAKSLHLELKEEDTLRRSVRLNYVSHLIMAFRSQYLVVF